MIGIIAAFWMPASPVQTKGGLRGKDGWFTEHEEKIMVNRVIRDDPSKGSMHNRQAVTPRRFWESLKDYHVWPIYALGLIWMIPSTPSQNYLTLQLRSQGFTTFQTNLLTIPAAVIAIITMIAITWVAERTNQRLLWGAAAEVWNLVLLIALELLPQKSMPWPRWAILTLLVGGPSIHPVVVALTSRNAGSVRTRTVASALYNMSVQVSNIAGANVSSIPCFSLDMDRLFRILTFMNRCTKQRMRHTTKKETKFLLHWLSPVGSFSSSPSSTTIGGIGIYSELVNINMDQLC